MRIVEMILSKFEREDGQALAEYSLILALIAVLCLIALGALGSRFRRARQRRRRLLSKPLIWTLPPAESAFGV